MNKELEVIIGGDFAPTESNKDLFCNGDIDNLFGNKLTSVLKNMDLRIFNLELPLISKQDPIKKCGPVLGIDENVIKGIKKLNPSCIGLANNHIMDHGSDGLKNTIEVLKKNNINFCGVGENVNNLNSFFIKEIDSMKICIYACAEHEFSIATEIEYGATPFNPLITFDEIHNLSKNCDFLIVMYHGGKEFYPFPSPNLQKNCRKLIDSGADFVICQHSHCIGCEEKYKDKTIIYGQGNFIFDDGTDTNQWNYGLLINFSIKQSHEINRINYYAIKREKNCIKMADDAETKKILKDYMDRSRKILEDGFIEKEFREFANSQLCTIFRKLDLFGNTILFRILNKITKQGFGNFYFKKIYLKRKSYDIQNILECEAWHEMALKIVKNYNEKNNVLKNN